MKRWSPIAYPGPGETHRNFNQSTGERGSWLDGLGYQQILDELSSFTSKSGLAPSAVDSLQVTKAVRSQALNYVAAAGGTGNALTVNLDPAPASLAELTGMILRVKITNTSTVNAPTLAVNGLAAQPVTYHDTAAMLVGELQAGHVVELLNDGTRWLLLTILRRMQRAIQVQATNWSVAGGTANALTVALSPPMPQLNAGQVVRFLAAATNTIDGPTLSVDGFPAGTLRYRDGIPVLAGELAPGYTYYVIYDGGSWILLNPILYFKRQAASGARVTRAFTPALALADITAISTTITGPWQDAQSVLVGGTSYADVTGYLAFKNTSASMNGMRARLEIYDGATLVEASDYLGCANKDSFQTPASLRARFANLNRNLAYTIKIRVQKDQPIGPVQVLDPLVLALHE